MRRPPGYAFANVSDVGAVDQRWVVDAHFAEDLQCFSVVGFVAITQKSQLLVIQKYVTPMSDVNKLNCSEEPKTGLYTPFRQFILCLIFYLDDATHLLFKERYTNSFNDNMRKLKILTIVAGILKVVYVSTNNND